MANEDQLMILRQGMMVWNRWRTENPNDIIDLSGADLRNADLVGANLSEANLHKALISWSNLHRAYIVDADLSETELIGAKLTEAKLTNANLSKANLQGSYLGGAELRRANLFNANLTEASLIKTDLAEADLSWTYLDRADLREANLHMAKFRVASLRSTDFRKANLIGSDLRGARLRETNLTDADLTKANLSMAVLVETNLENAILSDCNIYGISAWEPKLAGAKQKDLIITRKDQPAITVDNLEVAQFIYLLLHNEKLRDIIDIVAEKAVLILGRFTEERKVVLDAIKNELRKYHYIPILFDFEKSNARDIGETVSTLAHMARFIIADITDAKSVQLELEMIAPRIKSVPIRLILKKSDPAFEMIETILRNSQVIWPPYLYTNQTELLSTIRENIIEPAENKVEKQRTDLEEMRKCISNLRKDAKI
jgi:uncharacterized protein YjbI with pentapeptide repeats